MLTSARCRRSTPVPIELEQGVAGGAVAVLLGALEASECTGMTGMPLLRG